MQKRYTKGWTGGEVMRLRHYRGLGWTVPMIAREMRRPCASIRAKLVYLGLRKVWPLNDLVLILQQPHSLDELAHELGLAKNTISVFKCRMKSRGLPVWSCKTRTLVRLSLARDYR
jgi:hypothetical protein